jgi:hypothetical protein
MDAVVEAVKPVDGTQDAEASRCAIRDSLADLLTRFPEADLLSLDEGQRSFVIERFAAIDVYRRFELDVGQAVIEKAPDAATALDRLKQVKDYIVETVSASFRALKEGGRGLTARSISQAVATALEDTFAVFEGFAE